MTWWLIPLCITLLAIAWAFFWPANRGGMFGVLTTVFMLIPALVISIIAWCIGGALK